MFIQIYLSVKLYQSSNVQITLGPVIFQIVIKEKSLN